MRGNQSTEGTQCPIHTLAIRIPLPLHPFGMIGIYTMNVHDFRSIVVSSKNIRKKKSQATKTPPNSFRRTIHREKAKEKIQKDDTARDYCITGREGVRQ